QTASTSGEHSGGGSSVSTLVQVQLGLVAFLIAFTFGFAAQRFNERRTLTIDEANSIGTTYLRADFLPPKNASAVKEILRQYVDIRLQLSKGPDPDRKLADQVIEESDKLQDLLWAQALEVGKQNNSPLSALFINSVNETFDLQADRISA